MRDRHRDAGRRQDDGVRPGGSAAAEGALIKGDDLHEMILSGRVGFAGDPSVEAARQVDTSTLTPAETARRIAQDAAQLEPLT